jgi:hypothetical protein
MRKDSGTEDGAERQSIVKLLKKALALKFF